MQTSESEEGPSAHKSLTHLAKTNTSLGIYTKTSKTIKQWNSTVEYPNAKNKLSNK